MRLQYREWTEETVLNELLRVRPCRLLSNTLSMWKENVVFRKELVMNTSSVAELAEMYTQAMYYREPF